MPPKAARFLRLRHSTFYFLHFNGRVNRRSWQNLSPRCLILETNRLPKIACQPRRPALALRSLPPLSAAVNHALGAWRMGGGKNGDGLPASQMPTDHFGLLLSRAAV